MSGRPAPRPPAAAGRAATAGPAGRARPGTRPPVTGRTRRVRWKTVFFGLAAVAIVAGVAWALLGSRFLVVRSVQVTGTGPQVSRAQVLAAARIPAGLPLIRVNTAAVAQRVDGIRQVQSAQVSRNWPHTVVISVRPEASFQELVGLMLDHGISGVPVILTPPTSVPCGRKRPLMAKPMSSDRPVPRARTSSLVRDMGHR